MTDTTSDKTVPSPPPSTDTGPGDGAVPRTPRLSRNQRVAYAIICVTLGLVVGIWMALMLNGITATDEQPANGTEDLSDDLARLQGDVDAISLALEEAQGEMAQDEEAMSSMVSLVDEVQGRLDQMTADVENLMLALGDQGGDLEAIRADLEATGAEVAATREQLYDALMQLEYAKGRQDGTQVSVNMSGEDLSNTLVLLADAISQMEDTQALLHDAVSQLLGALGGGAPEGYKLPSLHLSHYESPLINFQCRMCHNANPEGQVVVYDDDLYFNGSLSSVDFRVQIDKTLVCSACHDWFPDGEMDPDYKDRNCVQSECHNDWARDMNSPYVNEANVTPDDCLLCHGGQPFYPR